MIAAVDLQTGVLKDAVIPLVLVWCLWLSAHSIRLRRFGLMDRAEMPIWYWSYVTLFGVIGVVGLAAWLGQIFGTGL